MYCENCGRQIPDGSRDPFCPACGGKLWAVAGEPASDVTDETMRTDGTPSGRGAAPQPVQPPVQRPVQTPPVQTPPVMPMYEMPPQYAGQQTDGQKKKSSGSKYVPVIIAACVAAALVVTMILVFPRMLKKDADDTTAAPEPETTVAAPQEATSVPTRDEGTTAVITAPSQTATAAPATTADEAQTNDVVVYTNAPATTTPATTTVYLYAGQTYVVASTTPAHAGVVLRGGPGSSYEKRATVKEGVVVLYTGQQNSGYVSVEYYLNGKHYSGWVVYRYLASNTTGKDHYNGSAPVTAPPATAAPTTTARQLPTARISNRTDDHLGLVLRSGPSPSTTHMGVLPEGTLLYLYGESSGSYTKVQVVSDGRVGWVMESYLDK